MLRVIGVLVAVIVGVNLWRSADDPQSEAGTPQTSAASTTAPAPLPPADPPYHGVAIQVQAAHEGFAAYSRLTREVAELGADTVLYSVNGFQERVESTRITTDPQRNITDEEWLKLFDLAHGLKLRIVLMPKILLSDPRGNDWRGKIQPTSWDAWFDDYKHFVVRYAELAEARHVEIFLVGSELISTEKLTDSWRDVIAAVREKYKGRVSYSANWDHYRGIRFWDDLDLIGMTTYHKLSDDPKPSMATLRESWKDIRERILEWQREVGKPILFTEAGWASQEGCSVEAWNYYRHEQATPEGLAEQKDCYEAFVEAWSGQPDVIGLLWWEWTADAGGSTDYGYTPKGKPAERVLRDLFERVRKRRAASRAKSDRPSAPARGW